MEPIDSNSNNRIEIAENRPRSSAVRFAVESCDAMEKETQKLKLRRSPPPVRIADPEDDDEPLPASVAKKPVRRHIRIQDEHGTLLKGAPPADDAQGSPQSQRPVKQKGKKGGSKGHSSSESAGDGSVRGSKSGAKRTSDTQQMEENDVPFQGLKKFIQESMASNPNNTKCDLSARSMHKMKFDNLVNFFHAQSFPRITELTLTRNYLLSPLPANMICAFPNTRRLFVNENSMTELPDEIKYLKQLWYLDARSNKITSLSDCLFDNDFARKSLVHLHMRSNKITSISPRIGELQVLTTVTLRSNQISELPDEIGQLSSLIQLDISYNRLKTLPCALGKCSKIEMLDVQQNAIEVLPDDIFANMPKLFKLGLKYNALTSLPTSLINTKVDVLNVESNKLTKIPESLIRSLKLTSINLNRNKLDRVPIQDGPFQWPELSQFSLDYNNLETIDMGAFSNCKNIHSISLINNQITCLPMDLGTWKAVSDINLTGNKLKIVGDSIGQLTNLEFLTLTGNEIRRLPKSIGKLINLKELNLEYNCLDSLPMEIGNLKSLQKLNVNGNEMLTIPYTIFNLRELTHLHLCENNLQTVPKEIGGLCSLQELYLSENHNLYSLPLELAKCPALQILALDKCPLTHFPPEYVMRGPACLMQFMRSQLSNNNSK